MLVILDDFYFRKELECECGDMNLERVKEMLRFILDEERSEILDLLDMIFIVRMVYEVQSWDCQWEMEDNLFVRIVNMVLFCIKNGYIGVGMVGV